MLPPSPCDVLEARLGRLRSAHAEITYISLLSLEGGEKCRLARALLRDNACFISKTVLLETSWVLGFTYGFDSASVNSALTALLGYPDVRMEDPDAVLLALDWNRRGLDLADALHLASSSPAPTFATFDRKLAMSAATLESGSEVRLLTP